MSTVWECIALKYLGKTVGGFSFISNLGAGLSPHPLSHEEVEETAKLKGAQILKALMVTAERFFGG
jgi:purine nucleoside phosphorylase